MNIVLREVRENDMPLMKKFTVETGWKSIPEGQKALLDREKWKKQMTEVFESLYNRENSMIFVAEDEWHAFVGYMFVGRK